MKRIRTQYKDLAENMRNGLPNAQYLALPVHRLGNKRLTNSWFGIMSVNITLPNPSKKLPCRLYYVKRVPEVELQNDFSILICGYFGRRKPGEANSVAFENHYAKELRSSAR